MSSSNPPIFPPTSVFIPAYWATARSETLTQEEADTRYLRFPVGQGTESIPNLIVSGTTTLGITTATAPAVADNSTRVPTTDWVNTAITNAGGVSINITDTASGTYFPTFVSGSGAGQTLRADVGGTTPFSFIPSTNTNTLKTSGSDASNHANFTLQSINTALTGPQTYLQLLSGKTGFQAAASLQGQVDADNFSNCRVGGNEFELSHTFVDNETTHEAGITCYNESGTDIPNSVLYNNYTSPSDNYIGVRCRNTGATQSIELFSGSSISAGVNIASFTSSLFTSYSSLTFNSNKGFLEKSNVEATTTGTLTMTSAYSFQTTINTPTANRTFVLPVASGQLTGTTYGICNKSTSFTIAVQAPSGTTIFTIPVASNSGGGSFAKFAIATGGTTYFRCG